MTGMVKRSFMLPMLLAALAFFFASPLQSPVLLHAATGPSASTPAGSPAHNSLKTTDANGAQIKCEDMPEAKGGVLLGRIVPCLIRTIANSTQSFSTKMIDTFKPLFYSYLVFVVTMFGVKILQGGRDLHQQAILLVLKITLVLMVLDLIPSTIIPSVYGIMQEAQEIVTATIGPDNSSIHCEISKFRDGNTPLIWAQMDCVLGKLYGFATGQATSADAAGTTPHNMFLAASIIGLAGGFFFSGTLGITLFLACIGVLFSVFMMVMRTAISFVNGYLLVCVMLIIAPLFLPLVFMKITSSYFEKWWTTILAAMLMPVLVTAYAMFALLLYDKALFAPDALVNKLFDYSLIRDSQVPPQTLCGRATTGNLNFTNGSDLLGGIIRKVTDPMTHDATQPALSGSNNACASLTRHVVDMNTLAVNADPNHDPNAGALDFIKHVFSDCLKLVVLAFLIGEGMKAVMGSIALMTGSQATSSLITATSPQEVALKQRLERMRSSAMQSMSYDDQGQRHEYKGTEFVTRLGSTLGNSIQRGFTE